MVRYLIRHATAGYRRHVRSLEMRVAFLEAQLVLQRKELRGEMLHERRRYEMALDDCRARHQALGPVHTPSDPPETLPEVHALDQLVPRSDWDQLGEVVGEAR